MKDLLPDEYSILIYGPPGVGKRAVCIDFMDYYLRKGCTVIYVTTERSYKDIDEISKKANCYFGNKKPLYVDYASWSTATRAGWLENRKVITVQNPRNLKDISMGVKMMGQKNEKLKVIFDSLSPLFLYNDAEKVIQFVQTMTTWVKSLGGFIAYTLQEGVHPPSTVNALIYSVDGYIQLRFLEERGGIKKQLRIHHLQGIEAPSEWRDFEGSEKKGILFRRP